MYSAVCIMCRDGFKLRDYREEESYSRLIGDKIVTAQIISPNTPSFRFWLPTPRPQKMKDELCIYITYYILPVAIMNTVPGPRPEAQKLRAPRPMCIKGNQ